jgi:hypothetical protein
MVIITSHSPGARRNPSNKNKTGRRAFNRAVNKVAEDRCPLDRDKKINISDFTEEYRRSPEGRRRIRRAVRQTSSRTLA